MSLDDHGEVFLRDLTTVAPAEPDLTENHAVPDGEDFDDDASQFTLDSINSADATDIYGNLETGPDNEEAATVEIEATENGAVVVAPPPQNALDEINTDASINLVAAQEETTQTPDNISDPTIPKGRSTAYHEFKKDKVVFLSFDIETGGEYCGILQMSAEIIRAEIYHQLIPRARVIASWQN